LPDGFFFGEGMKSRLKQALLEEANLHTIVRLPNGVFAPYSGIKTNILFFTKGMLAACSGCAGCTKPCKHGKHGAPRPMNGGMVLVVPSAARVTASLRLTSKLYMDRRPQKPKADVWTASSQRRL
jgi:hypothetical protein